LIASGYVAIYQATPLFVWLCWTVGSVFAIIRTVSLRDTPNSIIFVMLAVCNVIGIIRYFVV
jgi:hypothetical protein